MEIHQIYLFIIFLNNKLIITLGKTMMWKRGIFFCFIIIIN